VAVRLNSLLRHHRELLDAVVATIYNVDAAVRSHRDAMRDPELLVARASSAPFVNEHAFGGELLNVVTLKV